MAKLKMLSENPEPDAKVKKFLKVLCPSERSGQGIALALKGLGLEATYMTSRDLDLKRTGRSSRSTPRKGWSFPLWP